MASAGAPPGPRTARPETSSRAGAPASGAAGRALRRRRLGADHRARDLGRGASPEKVATVRPARSTVTRSAIAPTSSSLWVTRITVVPAAASARSATNSCSTSPGVSSAVGSSSARIRAPASSAIRISARWATPTGRSATRRPRIDREPDLAPDPGQRRRRPGQVEPQRPALAAEDRVLDHGQGRHQRAVLLDQAEPAGPGRARRVPGQVDPVAGRGPGRRRRRATRPNAILSRVDLPAPFSPTRAWIVPGATSRRGPGQRGDLAEPLVGGDRQRRALAHRSPAAPAGCSPGSSRPRGARSARLGASHLGPAPRRTRLIGSAPRCARR